MFRRLLKPRLTLALSALLVAVGACTGPGATKIVNTRDEAQYLIPSAGSQWYRTEGGSLYAWDGAEWYVCRQQLVSAGFVRGGEVGTPERWVKAGGSEVQSYQRTPETRSDMAKRPVFMPY